ncbi:uncharacterized protein Tco025E_06752 [Trypanosoma conorhini]|uniref:Uncharacterized protein n=1 Tax=Trypanosoma conorhini TaxID=83891 RepID=A0A422NYT8_9TRYP|nr:uncharacterized protein Tco025E_06752 [Trypanosoma conorhini]RNF10672.1 hypothetical protein Tco025E_06752 [Trypanosoma conorhini]
MVLVLIDFSVGEMRGGGGAVSSPREGSFAYTSPILASRRTSQRGGGPVGAQRGQLGELRGGNRGRAAAAASSSPTRHGSFLLAGLQKEHGGFFTPSRRSTVASAASAPTLGAALWTASTGHEYNIPVEGAPSPCQQVVGVPKKRGPLAASVEGLDAVRDEKFLWSGQTPLQTRGTSSAPMKSAGRGRSHESLMAPKWETTDRIESVARRQAMQLIAAAQGATLPMGVKTAGFLGDPAADDCDHDETACVALSYSFEAELRGRLLVEHVALWLQEDIARQKLHMCEDHARRMVLMQMAVTMQVAQNKRQHAARRRGFESNATQLAQEERDTLLASIGNLETEEEELLQRVERVEQQTTWNQQQLSMQEQETLAYIKMERHARIGQLRQLELRLEEALERRKRVVLDTAFGHNQGSLLSFTAPRRRDSSRGVKETDAAPRCTLRGTTFLGDHHSEYLPEHTPDSASAGNAPVIAAKDAMASCREFATYSTSFSSFPTAPLLPAALSVSPSTAGRGAFATVLREAMTAATALRQK